MEHLDRARDNINEASERAPGPVHTQLNSITRGIFEEEAEGTTEGSGPKIDRITEVIEKIEGLEAELDDEKTEELLVDARHHLREYVRDHPQSG